MPQFRIELRTKNRIWDAVPTSAVDLTSLRTEAAKFVGELLKDHANEIWSDEEWRVDVTDANGLVLFVMHIQVMTGLAIAPLRSH